MFTNKPSVPSKSRTVGTYQLGAEMNGSLLSGLAAIGAALVLLIVSGFAYAWKRRRSCRSKLDELVRQMIPVNDQAIMTVALDAVEPSGQMRSDNDRRALDRKQIWELLDGMDGICCMETNSRVLVQIAGHLERCYPKAAEAAEEVRLEARCRGWHTKWLHEAEKTIAWNHTSTPTDKMLRLRTTT